MKYKFELFTLGVALVIFSGIILSSLAFGIYLYHDYVNIKWSDEKEIVKERVAVSKPQIVGAVAADSLEEKAERVMEEVVDENCQINVSDENEVADLYLNYPEDFVEVWKDTAGFSIDVVNNGSFTLVVDMEANSGQNKSLAVTPEEFSIPPDSIQEVHIDLGRVFLTNDEEIIISGTAPGVDRTLILRVKKHNENNVKNVKSGLSGCGEFALY